MHLSFYPVFRYGPSRQKSRNESVIIIFLLGKAISLEILLRTFIFLACLFAKFIKGIVRSFHQKILKKIFFVITIYHNNVDIIYLLYISVAILLKK